MGIKECYPYQTIILKPKEQLVTRKWFSAIQINKITWNFIRKEITEDELFRCTYTRHSLAAYHQPLLGILRLLLDKLSTKSRIRRRTGNDFPKTLVAFKGE
ncbi:hypothetical protein KIN20_002784 [Parelaphostrongylus tenuis]|uniref:Uncharacterized protein n=1 Tax=Parelaphostrongylus tenuis TaxID=148309 RepID=A0AAD5MEP6_PARTN|nr:hypothetical protein KIN20_002784 [Parelaphostrongylus tenuis]